MLTEEHDVSVKSAIEIAANINKEKYEPLYIGITKSGVWKMCENTLRGMGKNDNCYSAVLSPDKKMHGLLVKKNHEYEINHVDVAFSALHGQVR